MPRFFLSADLNASNKKKKPHSGNQPVLLRYDDGNALVWQTVLNPVLSTVRFNSGENSEPWACSPVFGRGLGACDSRAVVGF